MGWYVLRLASVLENLMLIFISIERHPLARGGWCSRFVPQGFVMIYAPRSNEEVDTVMEIIKAGVGWISGEAFNLNDTWEVKHDGMIPFADTPQVECMDCRRTAAAS